MSGRNTWGARTVWTLGLATLLLASPAPSAVAAETDTKTNSTTGFFDNSSGNRTVTFAAADFSVSSTILDVNVSVSFAKHDGETFVPEGVTPVGPGAPFFNEIELVLISPAGTAFTLISNNSDIETVAADNFATFGTGAANTRFAGTIAFEQTAAAAVDVNPVLPTPGTFRPDDDTQNSLDVFNGESGVGTWTLFVEDSVGGDGLSFHQFSVIITTIGDAVPPTVTCAVGRTLLWPANRGLIDVGLAITATDNQVPGPTTQVFVFSDEDNGAAPYAPDFTFDGRVLKLRAERTITANGRVYLILVVATDISGNTARACCTVICPVNMTTSHLLALSADAAAAEATCVATGLPPAGYFAL